MNHPKNTQTRMGRPPLPRGDVRAERVVTFLTGVQKQQLRAFAETSDQSISAAAQDLIERGLTHEFRNHTDNKEDRS